MRTITPIKIKSYVSISFSYSAVGLTTIILVLLTSAILTSVTVYAQIFTFPNTHSDITSTTTDTHSRLSALQQQQANQPNLHLVKITSPIKGQQVSVGKELEIFGISADNATTSGCSVSVKVNGINPYQNVSLASTSGHIDYSKWNFTLTPAYTLIKPGQNKITAKFSCTNKPNLISHNSVNVTGVGTRGELNSTTSNSTHPVSSNATHPVSSNATHPVSSNATHPVSSNATHPVSSNATHPVSSNATHPVSSASTLNSKNNNLQVLSVSLHLAKNSLHPGDKQVITIIVLDKNSSTAVIGASVLGKISSPAGPFKNVKGRTDDTGKASYSWIVSNGDAIGKYKVTTDVSDPSYEKYSSSKTFKVTPIVGPVPSPDNINSNTDPNSNNHTPPIIPSDPGNTNSNNNNSPPPPIIPSDPGNTNSNNNHHNHHNHTPPIIPSDPGNTNSNNNHHNHHNHTPPIIPSNPDNIYNNSPPPPIIPSNPDNTNTNNPPPTTIQSNPDNTNTNNPPPTTIQSNPDNTNTNNPPPTTIPSNPDNTNTNNPPPSTSSPLTIPNTNNSPPTTIPSNPDNTNTNNPPPTTIQSNPDNTNTNNPPPTTIQSNPDNTNTNNPPPTTSSPLTIPNTNNPPPTTIPSNPDNKIPFLLPFH